MKRDKKRCMGASSDALAKIPLRADEEWNQDSGHGVVSAVYREQDRRTT